MGEGPVQQRAVPEAALRVPRRKDLASLYAAWRAAQILASALLVETFKPRVLGRRVIEKQARAYTLSCLSYALLHASPCVTELTKHLTFDPTISSKTLSCR